LFVALLVLVFNTRLNPTLPLSGRL
jgi:hypothetical protein